MSSGPAHRRRAAAAALAPGFRFHPTDEELVGYYLKRKIGGRPFRVNAISDIDLYKSEPWDLPGKSRIQSRDMEWYFFSALDKKYANRSRTNRATGSGYWKTTGKDRPVLCGGRQAGMKKTLVFHIGRAPKGERTNWVMHEYRLEDEELARARVAQDAFVVCRVFQKRGPGPQNGAQYGAPFVEEDWERDDDDPAVEQDDGGFPFGIINDPLLAEVDKSEQTQEWSAQDQAYLLEFQSMFETGNGDGGKDDDFIDHAQMTAQSPAFLNDEFLELNDFALSPVEAPPSVSNISYSDLPASIISEPAAPPVMQGIFNPVEEGDPGFSELLLLDQSAEGSSFLEINDILGTEPTQRNADEETPPFFDASGNLGFLEDDPHFLDSMASSSNGPDMVDELMAYFDATENTEPSELVNFEVGVPPRSNAPWVNRADLQPRRASPETSTRFPDELDGGRTKGGFSGRLVSMLGAISSPPALAAEKNPNSIEGAAVLEKALAAFSPGALRIAPATVQSWPPAKSDVGFLLDYGGGGGFEKPTKFPGGFLVFVQRNSFHLLFLSVLLLAASFKICVCVYSR